VRLLKKIYEPLLAQLKQGVSPTKLAQSVAFGMVLGSLPVIGVTTSLCLIAAAIFKLNHVAIQSVNYLVYPIQIALIIPYLRMGEWLFQENPASLDIKVLLSEFRYEFMQSLSKYGLTAFHGVVAWAIVSVFAFPIIYFAAKLVFTRLLKKIHRQTLTSN
jgi:uncharacterized protein (DUF2062 family)